MVTVGLVYSLLFSVFVGGSGLRTKPGTAFTAENKSEYYCMGTGQTCSGNECCPGYETTWGKTFPCPGADPAFYEQCESPSRLDLYSASKLFFSRWGTYYKRLVAPEGAEMFMPAVSWYEGVSRDLLIHALDDDGNRVNLTSDVVGKLVVAFRGKMMSIAVMGKKSVILRFSFGHMDFDTGAWTPDPLPWNVMTFMDLDAGSVVQTNERLTSTDHARYTSGSKITVVGSNDSVAFECLQPGNVPNPSDIYLSEAQKAVAFALEFENKDYFSVKIENFVWSSRAVLFAGITTVHWPELMPAPTPAPTASAHGDPHVSTITGETFDLWKTGWSTFVQIPRSEHEHSDKLLVRGDVRRYGGDACAPSFLYQVHMNGSWLGGHDVAVRAGSLESSDPFSVVLDGDRPLQLRSDTETVFLDEPDLRFSGNIGVISEDWGLDAKLTLNVRSSEFNIVQHTEGRGESSSAMLDLSVAGLGTVVEPIGGWLGVDGALLAGEAPLECRGRDSGISRVSELSVLQSKSLAGVFSN